MFGNKLSKFSFAGLLILVGTLLGAGVTGALGDLIFKPLFIWLGDAILNLATLGVTSIRDSLYVEVAKGTYERASLLLLTTFFSLFAGVLTGVASAWLLKRRLVGNNSSVMSNRIRVVTLLSFGVCAGMLLILSARTQYVVLAANHVEQLQKIAAPYISVEQRIEVTSKFAQIRTRSDYVNVVNSLNEVLKANNLTVPEFAIF